MLNTIKNFLILISFLSVLVIAEDRHYPPKYPWHLADIWWEAKQKTLNFNNLSIDFEIIGEVDDKVRLYIAPMGLGKLNGTNFYGGIQTNAGGYETKESKSHVQIGKGGIFSRWSKDNTPLSLDYAQGDLTTYYESAGYEGNFVSVRKKIIWNEGKYTYIINKLRTVENNNTAYTWFGAFVFDHKKQIKHYIGSLKFKGKEFAYGVKHAAFLEVYGGNKSRIPQIAVIFDIPKINNKYLKIKKTTIYYPDNGSKSKNTSRFAYSQYGKNKIIIITIPSGLNDKKKKEVY
ncbi:hypothetical protein HUE87_08850 [Candidatus Sulfurimonas marisnigri]|uniref:Uncharacterized protein n=1 Tax=Candidatus Sulfurimonas marisnigri TaxID=2740405 RepID=A0A7S7RPW8_9BACT|nr:hypothetical protein [Candidatus Sulfurimonas marisnigri]QOY53999.1 hypothetical protein HUE87_08850 [Candidatus Sulfurimonas marisnigri]